MKSPGLFRGRIFLAALLAAVLLSGSVGAQAPQEQEVLRGTGYPGKMDQQQALPEYYAPVLPLPQPPRKMANPPVTSPNELQNILESVDPDTYLLDAGDQLQVVVSGNLEGQYRTVVSADGVVALPQIGNVPARHRTLTQFRRGLNSLVSRNFRHVEVSVSLVGVRTFRISVVGEVERPGTFLATPFTRLSEALSLAGGITGVGSWRNIELRRRGASEPLPVDLFSMLLMGRQGANPRLKTGDTIFVPVRSRTVAVRGEMYRSGWYELAEGERILDILRLAGGPTPEASLEHAWLERITPTRKVAVVPLDLTRDTNNVPLQAGDQLIVPHRSLYQQTITLMGEFVGRLVFEKVTNRITGLPELRKIGLYRLREGERVREVLANVGGVTAKADPRHALIRRSTGSGVRDIPVDLERLLAGDEGMNLTLEPGDTFALPALPDSVFVVGEVRNPGALPYNPNISIKDYVLQAGGPTAQARVSATRVVRGDAAHPQVFDVDLYRILRGEPAGASPVKLEPGDIVYVPRAFISSFQDLMNLITNVFVIKQLFFK